MNPQKKFKNLQDNANKDFRFFLPDTIMSRYHPEIMAANDDQDSTINVYDIVGEDFWTGEGTTAKKVSAVLNRNKGKEITVNINSPGGSFFEGLAIYNLLKEHDGIITVRVIGMAASAASIIAMAGNTIKIAEAGYFMIHNAWNICVGNKNEMQDMAKVLSQFDATMAALYAKKTGIDEREIAQMMDDETWIDGKDAVDRGFASQFLDSDELQVEKPAKSEYHSALKEVDVALAKGGVPRAERRKLIKNLTSMPGAALEEEHTTPRASSPEKLNDALSAFISTIKQRN